MSYQLRLSEEADYDFRQAAEWYEQQGEGLGIRFINVIKNKLDVIQNSPERYPVRKYNFREAPVKTFPYLIIYKLYKRKREVLVYSIFHSKRNPKKKYRKK